MRARRQSDQGRPAFLVSLRRLDHRNLDGLALRAVAEVVLRVERPVYDEPMSEQVEMPRAWREGYLTVLAARDTWKL